MNQNPLLYESDIPPFDKIRPEHVKPAVTQVLDSCQKILKDLESTLKSSDAPNWDTLMRPLDLIDLNIARVWGPVSHLMSVMNSDEMRQAHESMQPNIVNFGLQMSQSRTIYDALSKFKTSAQYESLPRHRQRIIDQKLMAMKLSGVGLDGNQKERYNQIAQNLASLKTKFNNNALDSMKSWSMVLTDPADLDGLPDHVIALASHEYNRHHQSQDSSIEKGPWRFTLDIPSYLPFMENSTKRDLREKMYRARISLASVGPFDNTPIIESILALKHEDSKILGFKSFAEQSLATKMAGTVETVEKLLEELLAASINYGKGEHSELEEFAKSKGFEGKLWEWDISFYAERLKEERYQFSDEELRPYFPIDNVLSGMFKLVKEIFGVEVKESNGDAPVWHPDVRFFKVFDEPTAKHIASFYLDPFARPGLKRAGAWMDDCVNRRRNHETITLPVAHLVCNGAPPAPGKQGLMGFDEIHTLFHEFGHGLQLMLTEGEDVASSGINGVEWDAVELASQFMENWLYHEETLLSISSHIDTKERLPKSLIDKILKARNFRTATQMLRQLNFAMVDIELHHRHSNKNSENPHQVYNRISKRTSVFPPRPENRFLCTFSHIFAGGYAAGYYSYKWAEVLSADAFGAFEEVGFDNKIGIRDTGKRFRKTVLAMGGGEHPMVVFKKFRGRDPSTKALLRHSGLLGSNKVEKVHE